MFGRKKVRAQRNGSRREQSNQEPDMSRLFQGLSFGGSMDEPYDSSDDENEEAVLFKACEHGDLKAVEKLLAKGVSPTYSNRMSWQPIHAAALANHHEIVTRLLKEKTVNVDVRNSMRETPLSLAACYGHLETAKVLLAHGADPSISDWRGRSVLAYAQGSWRNKQEIVDLIQSALNKMDSSSASNANTTFNSHSIVVNNNNNQTNSNTNNTKNTNNNTTNNTTNNASDGNKNNNNNTNNKNSKQANDEDLKIKGNEAFNKKQFNSAIDYYSRALEKDKKNHILWCNRAAAYAELKQHEQAKQDAINCLALSPDYLKAHYRLAQANIALGFHEEALKSVEAGLRLDKDHVILKKMQQECIERTSKFGNLTGFPPSKIVTTTQNTAFATGEVSGVKCWVTLHHHVDATVTDHVLTFRVVIKSNVGNTVEVSTNDVAKWELALRNNRTVLTPYLNGPEKLSLLEHRSQDRTKAVLHSNDWVVVVISFRVPGISWEGEGMKKLQRLSILLPGNTIECPFDLEVIRKFYKGFTPGSTMVGDAHNHQWICPYDVQSAPYDDEQFMEGFTLRVKDCTDELKTSGDFRDVNVRELTIEELHKRIREQFLPEDKKAWHIVSLRKLPEGTKIVDPNDIAKSYITDETQLEVKFSATPKVPYTCANCSSYAKKKCAGCQKVRYCNSQCQRSHWKDHREFCKQNKVTA